MTLLAGEKAFWVDVLENSIARGFEEFVLDGGAIGDHSIVESEVPHKERFFGIERFHLFENALGRAKAPECHGVDCVLGDSLEDGVNECRIGREAVLEVDERIESEANFPAGSNEFVDCLQASFKRRRSMFDRLGDRLRIETKRSDHIGNRFLVDQRLDVDALGAQFEPCVRQFRKDRKKRPGETSHTVHGQTVAIVAAEEEVLTVGFRLGGCPNIRLKVLEIDEENIVGRLVHSLEEAVATVVQAVQHVGEVVVIVRSESVVGRGREDAFSSLLREDQGWPGLL